MENTQGTHTGQAKSSTVRKKEKAARKSKRPTRVAKADKPASSITYPPGTLFLVDGTIPSPTIRDAIFLADYLADTRERPVDIRRVVKHPGAPNVYTRKPFDHTDRDQIPCSAKAIVLDGDRVVYHGSIGGANAFARGRRAGVVCSVMSRTVTPAQQAEDDRLTRSNLESQLQHMEVGRLKDLRCMALRAGLKAQVKAFDKRLANIANDDVDD